MTVHAAQMEQQAVAAYLHEFERSMRAQLQQAQRVRQRATAVEAASQLRLVSRVRSMVGHAVAKELRELEASLQGMRTTGK